jgi:hypothetical protein
VDAEHRRRHLQVLHRPPPRHHLLRRLPRRHHLPQERHLAPVDRRGSARA